MRKFRGHDCRLCRKHRKLVRTLRRRWDERGIWMTARCPAGHRYQRTRQRGDYCFLCYQRSVRRKGVARVLRAVGLGYLVRR